MMPHELREAIRNFINGVSEERAGDRCSEIWSLLIKSFGPGKTSKRNFESKSIIKKRQAEFLKEYAGNKSLLFDQLPSDFTYLTEGGESKVYLSGNGLNVIKANDGSYYATWTEFFCSIILHNLLFPNTRYNVVGFLRHDGGLKVLVEQPFIEGEQANLSDIDRLLSFNEFKKVRGQDFFNEEFSIALEDMHDENVVSHGGVLFFIDTVLYLMETESQNE